MPSSSSATDYFLSNSFDYSYQLPQSVYSFFVFVTVCLFLNVIFHSDRMWSVLHFTKKKALFIEKYLKQYFQTCSTPFCLPFWIVNRLFPVSIKQFFRANITDVHRQSHDLDRFLSSLMSSFVFTSVLNLFSRPEIPRIQIQLHQLDCDRSVTRLPPGKIGTFI